MRRRLFPGRASVSMIPVALIVFVNTATGQTPFEPVTDAVLARPADADWLQWRRTYDGWAYSPLDQITRDNVGTLTLAWSRALNDEGGVQLIPLVHAGVMYIPHPGGVVEAVDATTGDLIWQYRRPPPEGVLRPASTTRNIAIYDDKILYAAPADGAVVALDARTGSVVWETEVHDNQRDRAFHSSGPIVVKGKVLTGRSCQPGGIRGGCFIAAHDADTGAELWRAHTIARPGEPGGDTWGGLPLEDRYHVSAW
ncbi:MAG: PQQ-binding-like beta-propeller repeat protein, partial [Gemmatimonadota bacterium]|nr:PQQ-binding-like beta-propeller repeat protein [Gemmatimonadota bacterium]